MGEKLMGASEKLMSAKGWSVPVFVLAWIICTAASPLRAQNQNPYGPQDEPSASNQSAPNQSAPPQQGDDATPSQAPQQLPSQDNPAPAQTQGVPAPRAGVPVPPTLTLPAGIVISARSTQWLSSDKNHPGDTFSATLDQPVVANGWVVARRGQTILGRVDVAQKASQGNGVSRLGVEITELTLVDGEQVPVSTRMQQVAPPPYSQYPGRSAATVATTTAVGAIIGAAVGRGVGAAIGAGLGATTGAAIVLSSRGRATMIAPEALLTFQLTSPVSISSDKGPVAFRPASQSDYRDQDAYANGPRAAPPMDRPIRPLPITTAVTTAPIPIAAGIATPVRTSASASVGAGADITAAASADSAGSGAAAASAVRAAARPVPLPAKLIAEPVPRLWPL